MLRGEIYAAGTTFVLLQCLSSDHKELFCNNETLTGVTIGYDYTYVNKCTVATVAFLLCIIGTAIVFFFYQLSDYIISIVIVL